MKSVLLFLALIGLAQAEPFVEAAGGYTTFRQYKQDGARFYQEVFPWSSDMRSPAWRVGIGNKINDQWDYMVSWLSLGRNSVDAVYVEDVNYDAQAHRCLRECDKLVHNRAVGSASGPEFALRRNFESVYLRGGLFVWIARLDASGWRDDNPERQVQQYHWQQAPQTMLAPFLGAGLRHKFTGGEVFAEASYYHVVESTGGYPLAKRAIVPMLGLRMGY